MNFIRDIFSNIASLVYLLFLVVFIYVIVLPIARVVNLIYRFLIHQFGVDAEAEVIEFSEPDHDEDYCVKATYIYVTVGGKRYQSSATCCIHWPSDQQSERIRQGYWVGARNRMRYISFFSRIHKVYFPEPPNDIIHAWPRRPNP